MDNNTKVAFPSIFDTAVEADKEFDTVFGGEEDNDLMDVVCGLKEDGTALPDEAELHQTDDDATPDDLTDELGEDHDTKNAPAKDESDAPVLNKEEGNNISCPKAGVEDSVAGDATKKVDPEDIEGEADKATEKFDEAYNALMREAAEDLGEEVPAAEETPAVETPDATEGGEDNCEGCEDDGEDLVSELDDDEETEESGTVDDSNDAGDPPDEENDETVKEDAALPADPDEEDLISKVEDETSSEDPSSEELEKELNTDSDEDLIDIVAGSTEAE